MTDQIKVFQMNDCDWMAAATKEEAIASYRANFGGDEHDEPLEETARELSAEEMDRLQFTDVDAEPDASGNRPRRSFREQLDKAIASGEEFPAFFASTEF